MSISRVQYREPPSSRRKDLLALWSLAFRTQKDTFLDGWLNKTPRQETATKHEQRARRKAAERAYETAFPVLKSRPLSGLHTIPKKVSKGAPLAANQHPKPPRDVRPKPPVGLQRE